MDFKEPGFIRVALVICMTEIIGTSIYKKYVTSLNLKGNENVLDFGSGSGAASRYIAQHLLKGNGRLTCVDISKVWMKKIKKKMKIYPNVEFKLGDISKIVIEDGSYDHVFVNFVLHDIEQSLRQKTVNALSRKLKDTGIFFVREPIRKYHGMPAEEIKQLMTQSGLKEIDYKIKKSFLEMPPNYAGMFVKT